MILSLKSKLGYLAIPQLIEELGIVNLGKLKGTSYVVWSYFGSRQGNNNFNSGLLMFQTLRGSDHSRERTQIPFSNSFFFF